MKRSEANRPKIFSHPPEPGHNLPVGSKAARPGPSRHILSDNTLKEGLQTFPVLEQGVLGKRKSRAVELHNSCKKPCIKKSNFIFLQPEPWTPEEDAILTNLVESIGNQKWSDVARMMPGREGKQCRERWHNHLSPSIKKSSWTEQEQWILFLVDNKFTQSHKQLGNKWSRISSNLVGRTDNSIKNHWNSMMRKKIPEFKEKLDGILVQSSAKTNKALQAEIINQVLEQQKRELFQAVRVSPAPAPQLAQRPTFATEVVPQLRVGLPHNVRKSSSGGSTNDDNFEESRVKIQEASSDNPYLFLADGPALPSMSLADRLENFPEDLQGYDYASFGLPLMTQHKKDHIRTGFEEFLEECAPYGRPRNLFSRDHSANGSSEKGFSLAFHNYDSGADLEY